MLDKFERAVRRLREEFGSGAVLSIVLEGPNGDNGAVSVVARGFRPRWRAVMPTLLRSLADKIESGFENGRVPLVVVTAAVGEPCGECEGCKRVEQERRLSVN